MAVRAESPTVATVVGAAECAAAAVITAAQRRPMAAECAPARDVQQRPRAVTAADRPMLTAAKATTVAVVVVVVKVVAAAVVRVTAVAAGKVTAADTTRRVPLKKDL